MNIQSNYPRAKAEVTLVEIAKMRSAAKVGQLALFAFTAVIIISNLFPNFGKKAEPSTTDLLAGLAILVTVLFSVVATMCCTMSWITKAHRAVCILRGITPRVPSRLLGFLGGIPYLLFSLPLCYALDFLVVRSESPDEPTMRWFSFSSRSNIVNLFAAAIIVDATRNAYSLTRMIFAPRPYSGTITLLDVLFTLDFIVAVFSGIRIARIVIANIEKLVQTNSQVSSFPSRD